MGSIVLDASVLLRQALHDKVLVSAVQAHIAPHSRHIHYMIKIFGFLPQLLQPRPPSVTQSAIVAVGLPQHPGHVDISGMRRVRRRRKLLHAVINSQEQSMEDAANDSELYNSVVLATSPACASIFNVRRERRTARLPTHRTCFSIQTRVQTWTPSLLSRVPRESSILLSSIT